MIALLRQRGLQVIIYLDDLLLLHSDPKELEKLFLKVCQLLTDLGFLIKKEKLFNSSSAIPCFSSCSDQLVDHYLGSTSDKVTRVTVRSTGIEKEENMCNKGTVGPSRANDSNVQDRGGICTPSLQDLTKTAHQVDSQVWNISSETTDYTHAGTHGRLGMVDINEATGGKISTNNGTDPQHHNPNRRIPAWLGGQFVKGKRWGVTGAQKNKKLTSTS